MGYLFYRGLFVIALKNVHDFAFYVSTIVYADD